MPFVCCMIISIKYNIHVHMVIDQVLKQQGTDAILTYTRTLYMFTCSKQFYHESTL